MPRQMLAVLTRQLVASPAHDGASHSTAVADGGLLLRLGCISGSAAGDSGDFEKVAYDTQGNCWRISACGQQVERRDCYSRSTTLHSLGLLSLEELWRLVYENPLALLGVSVPPAQGNRQSIPPKLRC